MGLTKLDRFDYTKDAVFEVVGYDVETVQKELEPRAALLANEIVRVAGLCPTMTIEILMDSVILQDSALDNRDRAMIILMAGPVIASSLMKEVMSQPDRPPARACMSKHGFAHNSGENDHVVLNMSKAQWDELLRYADGKVFHHSRTPELVENMQRMLDDGNLDSLQKAVIASFVVKRSAIETAERITPISAVIGPLATIPSLLPEIRQASKLPST